MKLNFDRNYYLSNAKEFQKGEFNEIRLEEYEFNFEVEDLAQELACTRYVVARHEALLRDIQDILTKKPDEDTEHKEAVWKLIKEMRESVPKIINEHLNESIE